MPERVATVAGATVLVVSMILTGGTVVMILALPVLTVVDAQLSAALLFKTFLHSITPVMVPEKTKDLVCNATTMVGVENQMDKC